MGRAGGAVATYLSGDPFTGRLRARRSFNLEGLARLQLGLEALDGGSPPLRGRATEGLQM